MTKSHFRDYATAAFRFYAVTGSADKYRQQVWEEAIQSQHREEGRSGISNPSEAAVLRADKAVMDVAAELADLEAVEKTIYNIEHMRCGNDIMKALTMVYMAEPDKDIEKGQIQERVHQAELFIPASEKTVYRWLSMARRMLAEERGLRI